MKKVWLLGLVSVVIIFLFSSCFQPFSPKAFTLQGVVLSSTGEKIPFAEVNIDGKTVLKTDSAGSFSVSLSNGSHNLVAKEPGSKSRTQQINLKKDLSVTLILDQTDKTEGWRYRKTVSGYKATFILLGEHNVKALSLQLSNPISEQQVIKKDEKDFLFVEQSAGFTQIDWTLLLREDQEQAAVLEVFDIEMSALAKIVEAARVVYSPSGVSQNGDYRETWTGYSDERAYINPSELFFVGDIAGSSPNTYAPNGIVNIWDLIRLLNYYGKGSAAEEGDFASQSTYNRFRRQPFSRTGLVPDSSINIYDLLVLLNAYGLNEQKINTPLPPKNLQIQALEGGEYRLTWETGHASDVHDSYIVYGSNTETSGERLSGTQIAVIPDKDDCEYEGAINYPYAYVTSKNDGAATFESSPSNVVAVPQPFGPPQIALLLPANQAMNQPLRPTLTWVATPGAQQGISQRGADITEFKVYYAKTEAGLATATPVTLPVNQSGVVNGSYDFTTNLEPESTWYWKVVVVQGSGNETPSEVRSFTIAKELQLFLSNTPLAATQARVSDIPILWAVSGSEESGQRGSNSLTFLNFLFGKVLSVDPLLSHVLLYLQKQGEIILSPYPTDGSGFELTNGKYNFIFPDPEIDNFASERAKKTEFPAIGLWNMWVQASGDSSKKDSKLFEVKEFEVLDLSVEIERDSENQPIEEASKVCADTTDGATVVYQVDLDFTAVSEYFDSWKIVTEVATKVGETATVITFAGTETQLATEVKIHFSTECTKYATVTLSATVISYEASNTETGFATESLYKEGLIVKTHEFILDLAAPTATILITDNSTETKQATITFFATDTKCLELEEIEFMVWIDKGPLGAWEKVFFSWPDVAVGVFATDTRAIGSGAHAATFTGQYNSAVDTGADASMTAWATFTLDMNPFGMDHATLTVAATVNDCCDLGISGHPVYTTDATLIDNVFLSSNFGKTGYPISDDVLLTWEGFKELDGKYYINNQTNLATPATLTVRMVDFTIAATTIDFPVFSSVPWSSYTWKNFASETSTLTQATYTCTGYATKMVWTTTILSTDTGFYPAGEEFSFCATFTATDTHGNVHTGSREIFVDTKPATLSFVNGYVVAGTSSGADDFVVFVFDENIDDTYPGFSATLTVLNHDSSVATTKVFNKNEITRYQDMTDPSFRISTKGFPLPQDRRVRVEVKSNDFKGNIGVAKMEGPVSVRP